MKLNKKIRYVAIISVFVLCVSMPIGTVGAQSRHVGQAQSDNSADYMVDEFGIDLGGLQQQRSPQPIDQEVVGDVEKPDMFEDIEVIGEGPRYTIGPGDILQIMVRNQYDFTGRFIVNDNGFIQYNWVGDVKAAGYTKEELKKVLIEKLTKYVRYPEVSVIILEYNSKFVYVLGEVGNPGKYPMRGDNLTLREAVIMAGLPNDESAMTRTKIIRETEEGPQAIKVNLKDVLLKGKLEHNYDLIPGDIIVIPTSRYHKSTDVASKVLNPLFQALAVYEIGFGDDDDGLFN